MALVTGGPRGPVRSFAFLRPRSELTWPILAAVGMKGTFYINSSLIGGGGPLRSSDRLTLAGVRAIAAAGHEIGGHTKEHFDMRLQTLDDAQAELKGPWSRSSNFKPHLGTGYLHDDKRGDGESVAVFRVKVPKSGSYDLRMAYSAHETRATKVPLTIQNGEKTVEVLVDQTQPLPAGEAFRSIGKVDCIDGATGELVEMLRQLLGGAAGLAAEGKAAVPPCAGAVAMA